MKVITKVSTTDRHYWASLVDIMSNGKNGEITLEDINAAYMNEQANCELKGWGNIEKFTIQTEKDIDREKKYKDIPHHIIYKKYSEMTDEEKSQYSEDEISLISKQLSAQGKNLEDHEFGVIVPPQEV